MLTDDDDCPRCDGTGEIGEGRHKQTCPVCRGSALSGPGEAKLRAFSKPSEPFDCNADLGHPCDADRSRCLDDDDEGDPCPGCVEYYAYWKREYEAAKRPCTLCLRPTANDDGLCSAECREACERDLR